MKTMNLFLAVLFTLISVSGYSQGKSKGTETIQIKTSAICDMCKERIEVALYALKGVKNANLEVSSKIVTVKYKPTDVTPEQMRKAITLAGYNADDMPADAAAYDKLPHCCQKGGQED